MDSQSQTQTQKNHLTNQQLYNHIFEDFDTEESKKTSIKKQTTQNHLNSIRLEDFIVNQFQNDYEDDGQVKILRDSIDTVDFIKPKQNQQMYLKQQQQYDNRNCQMLQGSIESSPNHTYESILLSQSETEKMQNGQNKANQLQFIYQGRDVHNKDVFEKFQRLFNENEQSEILEQFIQASSGNSRDSQTKNKFTQNLYTKTQLQAENLNSNQQLDHQKFQDYLKRDMTPIIEQKSTFEQSPSVNDLLRIISGQSLSNKISANVGKSGNINSSWNKRDQIQTNRSFYRLAGIMVLFCLALYSLVLNLRQDHSSSGFYNPIEAIQQFLMTKNLTTSQDQQSITISLHNQQLQSLNQTHHENLLQLKYELKQSELELKYLQSRLNDTQQNYDKCQNEKVLIESDLKQARAEIVEVGVFLSQELKNKAQSNFGVFKSKFT